MMNYAEAKMSEFSKKELEQIKQSEDFKKFASLGEDLFNSENMALDHYLKNEKHRKQWKKEFSPVNKTKKFFKTYKRAFLYAGGAVALGAATMGIGTLAAGLGGGAVAAGLGGGAVMAGWGTAAIGALASGYAAIREFKNPTVTEKTQAKPAKVSVFSKIKSKVKAFVKSPYTKAAMYAGLAVGLGAATMGVGTLAATLTGSVADAALLGSVGVAAWGVGAIGALASGYAAVRKLKEATAVKRAAMAASLESSKEKVAGRFSKILSNVKNRSAKNNQPQSRGEIITVRPQPVRGNQSAVAAMARANSKGRV